MQKIIIFVRNSTSTQINSKRAGYKDLLVLFSVSVRWKVTINENISFTDHVSEIRLSDCFKLTINRKNENDATIYRHEVIGLAINNIVQKYIRIIAK